MAPKFFEFLSVIQQQNVLVVNEEDLPSYPTLQVTKSKVSKSDDDKTVSKED